MERSRTALAAAAVSIIAAVIGVLQKDGIVVSMALFSALSSMVLAQAPDCRFGPKALGIAIAVLLVAVAMVMGLSYDNIVVQKGYMDVYSWALLVAVVYAIPLPALALLTMQALAVRYGASYNWALASSLLPFYALGPVAIGFTLTYFIQGIDTVSSYVTNAYIGWGVAVPLFASIAVALVLRRWMRRNGLVINERGLVSRT